MTTPLRSAAYVDPTALLPVSTGEEPVAEVIQQKLANFRYLLSAKFNGSRVARGFCP